MWGVPYELEKEWKVPPVIEYIRSSHEATARGYKRNWVDGSYIAAFFYDDEYPRPELDDEILYVRLSSFLYSSLIISHYSQEVLPWMLSRPFVRVTSKASNPDPGYE